MSSKNKTIADKTQQLNEMIAWFDGSEFSLEQALEKYEQAEKLAKEIENDLLTLKNEIQIIKQRFDS